MRQKPLQTIAILLLMTLLAGGFGMRVAEAQEEDERSDEVNEVVDVLGFDMHPNGAQVIVTSVAVTRDATTIEGRFINGRDFPITVRLDTEDTLLRDDRGRTYELIGEGPRDDLDQGTSATFVLSFEPIRLSSVEALTVELNARADDDRDLDERSPGFTVANVDPTGERVAALLPEVLPVDERSVHPAGLSLEISRISFANQSIGLHYSATNTTIGRRSLSRGHHASFLEDDLGNRYNLKFEGSGRTLAVERESTSEGIMIFGGRIAPGATMLRLVLNSEESLTDSGTLSPKFEMGPWTFASSTADGDFERLDIDEEQAHPNGVVVNLASLTFADEGTLATINVENPRATSVLINPCCRGTYLEDDLGNRYLLEAPDENPSVRVERRQGIDANLAFPGAIDPRATTIELVIGDREDNSPADEVDPMSFRPFFRFGPYELERAEASTSDVETEELVAGLEAIVVDDGVLLTLPSRLLFEDDDDALKRSASGLIDVLLDLVEFYEGDDLVVIGHTDNQGRSFYNLGLSAERAATIRQALIDGGIDRDLVTTEARGESDAIANNSSAAGREANNRIEILILTSRGLPN